MSGVSVSYAGAVLPPSTNSAVMEGASASKSNRSPVASAIKGPEGDFRTRAFAAALDEVGQAGAAPENTMSSKEADIQPYSKFEAMFVSQLVSTMLSTGGEGMFGEEGSMDAFSSIFAGAIGDAVVKQGGIGLAETIARSKSDFSALSNLKG